MAAESVADSKEGGGGSAPWLRIFFNKPHFPI